MIDYQQIDCARSDVFSNKSFLDWLEKLKIHVQRQESGAARWRMRAYEHGQATYVALDRLTTNRDSDIAITICITPGEIEIAEMVDSELNISLPGLVEVMKFTECLIGEKYGGVQIAPWTEKQDQSTGT